MCLPPHSPATHDLAEAPLHLHVGLTVFVDVGLAVLTPEPKFVIDLEGENICVRFWIPFSLVPLRLHPLSSACPPLGLYPVNLTIFIG